MEKMMPAHESMVSTTVRLTWTATTSSFTSTPSYGTPTACTQRGTDFFIEECNLECGIQRNSVGANPIIIMQHNIVVNPQKTHFISTYTMYIGVA